MRCRRSCATCSAASVTRSTPSPTGDTLTAFRAYARLHTALEPYLHRAATIAHRTGLPIIRPLFLEYPDDDVAYDVDDQYLLGAAVLVAPVLRSGARSRTLYLPAGVWRHYWTGRRYDGGRWITVAAPVPEIPLFIAPALADRLPTPEALLARPGRIEPEAG